MFVPVKLPSFVPVAPLSTTALLPKASTVAASKPRTPTDRLRVTSLFDMRTLAVLPRAMTPAPVLSVIALWLAKTLDVPLNPVVAKAARSQSLAKLNDGSRPNDAAPIPQPLSWMSLFLAVSLAAAPPLGAEMMPAPPLSWRYELTTWTLEV